MRDLLDVNKVPGELYESPTRLYLSIYPDAHKYGGIRVGFVDLVIDGTCYFYAVCAVYREKEKGKKQR